MPLYAGVCETDITPPLGIGMAGYAMRPSGCTSVHDPLYARACVLASGSGTVAILSMDLIGLDFDLVDVVRRVVQERTGIPSHAVLLNASHTHAGPASRVFNAMGPRDEPYIDLLCRKLAGIVQQAMNEMRAATLGFGSVPLQIGINRRESTTRGTVLGRNYGGPTCPSLDLVALLDSRGEPFAALFSHACHPTTVGGENLAISAEWCGVACDLVKQEMGGGVTPLFLQGCCGDINPHPRGRWSDVEAHGRAAGLAALEALEEAASARLSQCERIEADEVIADLPVRPPRSEAEARSSVEEWSEKLEEERSAGSHESKVLWAEGLLRFHQMELEAAQSPDAPAPIRFAIQRLRLGEAQFVGFPGEMFVAYQNDLRKQAPGPLLALGYTNGIHGYVPTAAAYLLGGYEVDFANRFYHHLMFAPECERLVREKAYELAGVQEPDWTPFGA